jgi:hypothetical protein
VAHEVISRGGTFTFVATGYSMVPVIADGDRVVLATLDDNGPQIGEILLVRTQEGPRLHRFVAWEEVDSGRGLRVRGDAQRGSGELVQPSDVGGRVVKVMTSPLRRLILLIRHRILARVFRFPG